MEGRIGREAFQRVVGDLIREAGSRGRPVRAYGEMVDLLWQQGAIADAIELETCWNELIAALGFSLLCAYQSEAVAGPEHEHALRDVCRLHTTASSGNEVSRQFPPEDGTPFAARRFLEETLRRWGHGEHLLEDARLLLSELVTNAVVHAGSRVYVSIRSERSKLRLSVQDENPIVPRARADRASSAGGHGLAIVSAVARRWGVDAVADGKVVWAEL